MKASEKQSVCKKLVTALKKRYTKPLPKNNRSVLETLLYAVCLENESPENAEAAYKRLHDQFYDYNEMRVSSLTELERVFEGSSDPEYRAVRVRCILQDIFEKYYQFDFEVLRRKTLDAATKQLAKFRHLSDFVRDYALQQALEAHLVPLDEQMRNAVVWLGLVEPDESPHVAGESLKPALRKADAPRFCHLLKYLSNDPALVSTFKKAVDKTPEDGFDPETAVERLGDLFSGARKRKTKKTATKRVAAKRKTKSRPVKKKKATTKRKAAKVARRKK